MDLMLLTALMIVLFSFQSLFTRLYTASYAGGDVSGATPVFTFCYGFVIALASFIAGGFKFHASSLTWLFGLLNALMLILYNTSMIRAGSLGSYAFMMTSSLFGGIVVPLIAGILFLKETMTFLQWIAVVLMLTAIVMMNSKGLSLKKNSGKYYLWCAFLFLSNGLYGLIMKLQSNGLNGAERTEMLVILFGFSALAAALMEVLGGRGKRLVNGLGMGAKSAVFLACCCISAFSAVNLMMYLLTQIQSTGLLYTMQNGGVLVLSFLYSVLLFKEKPGVIKLGGMALAVASMVMLNI